MKQAELRPPSTGCANPSVRGGAAFFAMPLLLFLVIAAALWSASAGAQESADWFETDTLNAGLPDPPVSINRETPRETVDGFIALTQAGRFTDAAHFLDLHPLDRQEQKQRGAVLARMLSQVIERRVVIDWADLPDRPDAINATLPDSHPFAGKTRRSLVLAEPFVESRPLAIRLNRLKPGETDPVWVFSRQTVENIPRLHAAFGPGWFESLLPYEFTRKVTPNLRLWELFVLPALLLAAVGLFLLLNRLIGFASRRVSVTWINRASERARAPMAIGLTSLIVQLAVGSVFTFSGIITTILSPLLLAVTIFGITFAALRTIDATLEVVTDRYVGEIDSKRESERRHLYTNIYALRRYILLVAVVISLVTLLASLGLFDNIGMSLLASAGVVTVVLGIAGQNVLGNILASLQIAIAKPIRIGDAVEYEGRWAYVESIYYTYVTLRCWDERRLMVPVKHFVSQPFENWTIIDAKSTRTFSLELDLSAEPDVLREVFEELAKKDKDVLEDEMLLVALEDYRQFTQVIRFYATADNPTDAWRMHARLAEQMGDWIRDNHPEWWPRLRLKGDGVTEAAGREAEKA